MNPTIKLFMVKVWAALTSWIQLSSRMKNTLLSFTTCRLPQFFNHFEFAFLDAHPKAKQWAWFVSLWFAGLATVVLLAYPIKLLIKFMR